MSAKTPVEKKHIRDLLQEKDAFLTTSEKFLEYFLRHTKAFIAVGVTVVVLIVGIAFYVKYQASAEAAASEAYEQALALVGNGPPDNAIAALEKVRGEHQGRKADRLAGFSLIPLYEQAGQGDKALNLAENLLQTLKPGELSLKPLLLTDIGGLSESQAQYDRAILSYETLLALPNLAPPLKMDVMMALGRSQAAAGRQPEAIKTYEAVVKEFPQSMNAFIANYKAAALKGEPVALFPSAIAEAAPAADEAAPTADEAAPVADEAAPAADEAVPAADEAAPAAPEEAEPAAEPSPGSEL